jgi:acetoin utilization deacetylase AcuC-like enzyme
MKAFYCDHFVLPLPEGHRFPMGKYALLRQRVETDPRMELLVPGAASDGELARVHTPAYLEAVLGGTLDARAVRRIGFPWSPQLVERSRRSVGGTLAAARAALDDDVAANLAGGTHHAYPDRGEGFCVFNDVGVAVRALQAEGRIRRAAVVDLDVHQGNGTAAVFAGDPSVFTLSVHGRGNYPFNKEAGDLDISLPDGTGDDVYLDAVERGLRVALQGGPELVLYVAGVDPYEGDALGRLSVTRRGMASRDALVYDLCLERGVPVAVVMSGGYAPDPTEIADLHATTVRLAADRHAGQALAR